MWRLWTIFLLGLFLRIVWLDISPPGFNADEATLGYNAYSLIKTGKDEWGQSWPLTFKSFADYKPGLYVYLAIPFIALMGLTELAVRLPSILLGALSVVFIYLLSKEFFQKETMALSSAFLLAVSPWHLHYSRGAWETNVATFFILAGVWTFLKGLRSSRWLWLAGLSLLASMYTYQSPRVIVPTLVLLATVFYGKKLAVKTNIVLALTLLLLSVPLLLTFVGNTGLARFQGVSIFSDIGPLNRINQDRGEHQNPDSFWAKFYHNKLTNYGRNFLKGYLDHFSPDFLFINGDVIKRNKVPGMGQLYLFEMVTLILGVYFLLKRKLEHGKVVWWWLLVAPLAAALTFQTPHALRAHNMVVPLTLLSGLGLGVLIEKIWQLGGILKYWLLVPVGLVGLFFISSYLDQYHLHLPKYYALEWEYGFSQMVPFIMENKERYKKIVITDRYDQPYVLLLFYARYDPMKYQQQSKKVMEGKFGFSTIASFDKFEFRPITKEEIPDGLNTLFVGTKDEFSEFDVPLKVINFPNNTPAFKIVGT